MKVEKNSENTDQDHTYIVGGYASHGWHVSGGLNGNNSTAKCIGDETCFLFNLTNNLRFNARKGMK